VFLKRRKAVCRFCETPPGLRQQSVLTWYPAFALAFLLLLDFAVFAWLNSRNPRGGWDAWAIWNLRARFFYRAGGTAWRDAFTDVIAWSHPDYPLLLPAFVARSWQLLGHENNAVPVSLACFFTFGCAGLLTSSLTILRGARQGVLAGLALAATPSLYAQGAMQAADVPLAFFILATLACFAIADRFNSREFAVLAGMAAALSGWTKNEGLLWFAAFLAARIMVMRWRSVPAFLAGAAPVLASVLLFKARVATAGDIFGGAGRAGMMARALDPARYVTIAREAVRCIQGFGPLFVSAFAILAVYMAVAGLRRDSVDRAVCRTGVLALLFLALGYGAVYLLHPNDLRWELDNSSDRLLLQFWPGVVFVACLACRGVQLGADVNGRDSNEIDNGEQVSGAVSLIRR
jgi:hypothetical protein